MGELDKIAQMASELIRKQHTQLSALPPAQPASSSQLKQRHSAPDGNSRARTGSARAEATWR